MTAKTKVTGGHLETWVRSLGWEDPLEKGMAATPVFWPGESHGLNSPWDHKEFDISERLSLSLYPVKGFSGGASGNLGVPSRRGLTPRGSLECNPEIPAFPGEEN